MKKILALAISSIALGAGVHPAHAGGALPWCEIGAMFGNDVGNCAFYTLEQCLQMARGDGTCQRNPRFDSRYLRNGQPAPVDVDPYGPPPRRDR